MKFGILLLSDAQISFLTTRWSEIQEGCHSRAGGNPSLKGIKHWKKLSKFSLDIKKLDCLSRMDSRLRGNDNLLEFPASD